MTISGTATSCRPWPRGTQDQARWRIFNPLSNGVRAVFLDRDGVICQNREDHVKSWEEFTFLPHVLPALQQLARTHLRIIVVTNQAVINRRLISVETLEEIHTRMVAEVQAAGGRIDAIYYCPHRPEEECSCRKPQPGMLLQAARDLSVELANSYLVGDAESDLLAGKAAGCRWRYLVLTGRGWQQLYRCWTHGERDFKMVSDLSAAVDAILRQENCLRPPLRLLSYDRSADPW